MRLAVDRDGLRAARLCGESWRDVELADAPLVRRAMPMLATRAWAS
jgi:hypothetical protein